MDWDRACAAIIPCRDEAAHIGGVVAAVRRFLPSIVVVDDGSRDATASLARQAGAEVISLARNQGKGAALRTGWLHARACGFQWVLMLDGDGQHCAGDIPQFFQAARQPQCSLVVGNRMLDTASMPRVRRWANRWMSRRISHLVGQPLPDSQCGFRLAHVETLLRLPLRVRRFEIESAMLAAFIHSGHRVEFVPVKTIYRAESSKINPVTDSWRWLRWRLAQGTALRDCNMMRVPK